VAGARRGCLGIPLALWLPGLYLAFALYAWIDFTRTNHDGLANIGLMLITLPVTLIGLLVSSLLGHSSFILLPSGHGYLGDHALYYAPAVAITASGLWWIGRTIDRMLAR
jgi:hypothetical protein